MNRTISWSVAAVLALGGAPLLLAQSTTGPGIIAVGSPLIWSPTNVPDTFTANTTFSSTPVTVDNGAVTIWQQQVPTGPNGEWDIFWVKTTSGGPLANNINGDWNITTWIRRENASSGLKGLQLGCPGENLFREAFYHR